MTLYSTLCDWNVAKSQFWKTGGTNATIGNGAASLLAGKSSNNGWDVKNYSCPLSMDGENQKSRNWRTANRLLSVWALLKGQYFLVSDISQSG